MIIPKKYQSVNWTDGMKVNKEHFISTENFVSDSLRDVASVSVNSYNFGLLPPLKGSGAVLSNYAVSKTATNQLQIRVGYCQAITPGGVRISITGDGLSNYALSKTIDLATAAKSTEKDGVPNTGTEYFYVVIVANLFERVVSGNPDPEEVPVRQPFTQPYYDIELMHATQVSLDQLGGFHLVIGRIAKTGDDFSKDESFIPPCSSITSNDILLERYKVVGKAMEDVQNLSLQIVQKINYKDQKSQIAQDIKAFCQTILGFSNQHYFYFRNMVHQQPPVFLLNAISSFSSFIHSYLQTLPEKEKEALLNYFFEWSDITPVIFLSKLSSIIEIDYNHYAVGGNMNNIISLLHSVVLILEKLNTLEYIGQHKENIVVKEEVVAHSVKEKKGWSILD
ncbi:MAG: hypothetical protein QM726_23070 [Chitinophagaceae bacterium]